MWIWMDNESFSPCVKPREDGPVYVQDPTFDFFLKIPLLWISNQIYVNIW